MFITTPNKVVLEERLRGRKSDNDEVIEMRLVQAYNEMQHIDEFDFLIVNDDIARAQSSILAIVQSLECIQTPSKTKILLKDWMK